MTFKKAQKRYNFKFIDGFSIFISVFLVALIFKNTEFASAEVKRSLTTCATVLIPSLFPLTAACEAAAETGAVNILCKKIKKPLAAVLGLSEAAIAPLALGLFGSYAAAAKSAVSLFEQGAVSSDECETVIALSAIPSPAFMIGFLGAKVLGKSTDGCVLWAIAIFSSVILGAIVGFFQRSSHKVHINAETAGSSKVKKSFPKIAVDAINHSAQVMFIITACVVFFSTVISIFKTVLLNFGMKPETAEALLGFLELTRGVSSAAIVEDSLLRTVLCAAYAGWSGLCVHFQILSICNVQELSFKKYFILKIAHGLLCAFLAFLVFWFVRVS